MIHDESAEDYHARQALSASMAHTALTSCWRKAWHRSPFNPDCVEANAKHFDIGRALHLAILEPHKIAERIVCVDAENWRTKAAQELCDEAYAAGKTPLLRPDVAIIRDMGEILAAQGDLFLVGGKTEVSFTWEWNGVACKARADYLTDIEGRPTIVDLKSAASASPAAFQRSMIRDGHHLRAAWYSQGFMVSECGDPADYIFLVVEKDPPHLVQAYRIDARAMEWGWRLCRRALNEFRQCRDSGDWWGYSGQQGAAGEKIININLPDWSEYQLAQMEADGKL